MHLLPLADRSNLEQDTKQSDLAPEYSVAPSSNHVTVGGATVAKKRGTSKKKISVPRVFETKMQRAIRTEGDRGITSMSQEKRENPFTKKKCSSVLEDDDGNEQKQPLLVQPFKQILKIKNFGGGGTNSSNTRFVNSRVDTGEADRAAA